jgi:endonuclease/exonuclease/phosphatase family metal-dependent hydrolase
MESKEWRPVAKWSAALLASAIATVLVACESSGVSECPDLRLPDHRIQDAPRRMELALQPDRAPAPPDAGLPDLAPDARVWPDGFVPLTPSVPAGHLCHIPGDYVSSGGNPAKPPCGVEADLLSDQDPLATTGPPMLKVVSWNVEYGKKADAVVNELLTHPTLVGAHLLLLQEVPRNDQESVPPGVNLARVAAQKLRMNYVFAVEWDRRLKPNQGGEHGVVVLSKFPLGNLTQIRHTPLNDFYAEKKDFGGRMTLGVDVVVAGQRIRIYSAHLCTRDLTGAGRALQGAEVRTDAAKPGRPPVQILGGDLNTFLCNPIIATCYQPPAAEQVVEDFLADQWDDLLPGFGSWTELGLDLLPQRLDWLFGKGVTHQSHTVLQEVRPSDHVPIVTVVSVL